MTLRIYFIFSLLLATSTGVDVNAQALSEAPRFDPYLPGELNERALYSLQTKDVGTALILLERAYRLNPNSPDIKANLEIVRNTSNAKIDAEVRGEVIHLDAKGNPIEEKLPTDIPALWPESKSGLTK